MRRNISLLDCILAIIVLSALSAIRGAALASSAPQQAHAGNGNITTLYISMSGHDSGICSSAAPCATLKYAVEAVAAFMSPLDEPVPIQLITGNFTANSCGVTASRPLNISGGGSVIDCEGADRVLLASADLWLSSLTILNGNSTGDGGGLSVYLNGTSGTTRTLSLWSVMLINCTAAGSGGGLSMTSCDDCSPNVHLTLLDVHVLYNTAVTGNGGGVSLYNPGDGVWSVTATSSSFSWNQVLLNTTQVVYGTRRFTNLLACITPHSTRWRARVSSVWGW